MHWFTYIDYRIICLVYSRRADLIILTEEGKPYLYRWHLIRRNRWFNFYYHHMSHSDDDRALHDHRADNVSIVLTGGYWEHTASGDRLWRGPGDVIFRRAETLHRIELPDNGSGPEVSTSLFIKLPDRRRWGFKCPDKWIDAEDFNAPTVDGVSMASKGCG